MQQYNKNKKINWPLNKLGYLHGPGQPVPFPRTPYYLGRSLMVAHGGLWIEPKPLLKPPVLESEKRNKDKKDAEDAAKAVERAQDEARLAEQRASAAAQKEAAEAEAAAAKKLADLQAKVEADRYRCRARRGEGKQDCAKTIQADGSF